MIHRVQSEKPSRRTLLSYINKRLPLRVPCPASSPPPDGGGLSFCRPSGRPASTKHPTATAPRRFSVSYARRPRSRPGIPPRLRRSGGRRRFALAASRYLRRASLPLRAACVRSSSPGVTHARGTGETPQGYCHLHGSQPLLALLATLSVCLRSLPYRIRRGYCRPTLLPYPSASTACRRPSLCSDADLLCPLSALTLATGQVFTADHASVSIVPSHCHEQQPPPDCRMVSVAAGGNPPSKRFLPFSAAHPTIDVMQSSRARRVYSPLPLRLRLHNAGYCPTCGGWRQPTAGLRCAVAVSGSGHGRPLQT